MFKSITTSDISFCDDDEDEELQKTHTMIINYLNHKDKKILELIAKDIDLDSNNHIDISEINSLIVIIEKNSFQKKIKDNKKLKKRCEVFLNRLKEINVNLKNR
jgi:hypothetical protein